MSGKEYAIDVEGCTHSSFLLKGLNELRQNHLLCDVVLRVGNVHIQAHRVVLAGCSPYFRAMFTGSLSESEKSDVDFKSIDSNILQSLVDYAYTGQLPITELNVQCMLPAANLLQMHAVTKQCCDFLGMQLHPSNCIGIKKFAEVHSCPDLYKKAFRYLLYNINELVESEEFLQSEESDISHILSHDDLAIATEWKVFLAIKSWIQYDSPSRRHLFGKLINCVRFTQLPVNVIEKCMQEDSCHVDNVDKVLTKSLKYKLQSNLRLQSGKADELGLLTRPRQAGHAICAVAGKNGKNGTLDCVEVYLPKSGQWTKLTTLPHCRFECGAVVLYHKLYVVGGMLCNMSGPNAVHLYDGCVECLDTETKEWSEVAPIQQQRSGLAVTVLQGCIYVLGGYDGESYLSSVEQYSPMTDSWKFVQPMLQSRSCFSAATLDEVIYAIGGYGPPCLNSVECYIPEHDSWQTCASMTEKRINCGVAVTCGFLYVAGGHNGAAYLSSVERYDPYSNQWSRVSGMGKPRTGLGMCVIEEQLYVVGGHSGSSYLNTVQRYDPYSDTWCEEPNMSTCRCSFGLTAFRPSFS